MGYHVVHKTYATCMSIAPYPAGNCAEAGCHKRHPIGKDHHVGRLRRISLPTAHQFIGLHELMRLVIFSPAGAGPSVYCVLPGNKNLGYCTVKVYISTWWPSL